jgi:hypothetical protein
MFMAKSLAVAAPAEREMRHAPSREFLNRGVADAFADVNAALKNP